MTPFGGNSIEKRLMQIEENIFEPNLEVVVKRAEVLAIENGNMAFGAASTLTLGQCINEFATHYVRTKLTLHPKRITERNFKDKSIPLSTATAVYFRYMYESEYPLNRCIIILKMMLNTPEGGSSFETLIEDISKIAPLESLINNYPLETNEALDSLVTMYKFHSLRSSHELHHEHFSSLMLDLKINYF